MKIRNSALAFLAAGAARLAEASPSCPKTLDVTLPFDQSCMNSCSTGPDPGALVGPSLLDSGEADAYDVAAIYFGQQEWGTFLKNMTDFGAIEYDERRSFSLFIFLLNAYIRCVR